MALSEESIFAQASEKKTPEERSTFLAEACAGDPELRRSVESLLAAYDEGQFLESPAAGFPLTTNSAVAVEMVGTVIGPYKLLQEIGEGGMGVVYMAEQTEPVERRVALKIIKPGMDTREVIARFEAERQALATMDHPNIAKVLDAGATESGRPYFVMELVKGVPITQYCDEHHLTPRQRLDLFLPVCHAVQHAHQKGIIHRDIKPSNVLAAEYDGRPVPKIIDFGVAKAIQQRLTERTVFTQLGQVVGTIDYMSPEQANLNQLDIDTRTDVYSLGVLLYELLTGETPLDRQRLRSAAFDEMLRIIREDEPPNPSARLRSSESLPSIAANRRTEPKKLSMLVRGELDWIVMKALEKDRTRRYETANVLAADVEHYLTDEPVVACPPSATYRFRKFARRNKGLLAAIAIIGVILVVATLMSTSLAIRTTRAFRSEMAARHGAENARREADDAREQAEKDRDRAVTAEQVAEQERQTAEEQKRQAEEQKRRAERVLAELQIERGLRRVSDGESLGLLDLAAACKTAEDVPELKDQTLRLWAIAHAPLDGRLVQVLPRSQACAFSPDRELAATATGSTAQMWDILTWRKHGPPLPLERPIHTLAFSPDGTLLAVHSLAGVCQLFHTTTGEPAGPPLLQEPLVTEPIIAGETKRQRGLAMVSTAGGDLLATASLNGTVQIWELPSGKPHGPRLQHGGAVSDMVRDVDFSPDGKLLATGSATSSNQNRAMKVWDVATGQPCGSEKMIHVVMAGASMFSPDGQWLASRENWKLSLLNSQTWAPHEHSPFGANVVYSADFSPDGRLLAIGGINQTVQLWDIATGQPHGPDLPHDGEVKGVAFTPDGQSLVTGSKSQLRVWDVKTGQLRLGPTRFSQSGCLQLSSDGSLVVTLGEWGRGGMQVWRVEPPSSVHTLGHSQEVDALAFSPDSRYLATAAGAIVRVWEVASGQPQGPRMSHPSWVKALVYAPDGKTLYTGGRNRIVRAWDPATGQMLWQLPDPATLPGQDPRLSPLVHSSSLRLALTPDGRRLAVLCNIEPGPGFNRWAKQIWVWDLSTRQPVVGPLETGGGTSDAWALSFSPNGQWLAGSGAGSRLGVWRLPATQPVVTLNPMGRCRGLCYRRDGQRLAAVSTSHMVLIWDVSQQRLAERSHMLALVLPHPQPVWAVDYSPDGQWLATGCGKDRADAVTLWDLSTAAPPNRSMHVSAEVAQGQPLFSPDGQWLASTGTDGRVRLWRLPRLPRDAKEVELATLLALGGRTDEQERRIPLDDQQWQQIRQELQAYRRELGIGGDEHEVRPERFSDRAEADQKKAEELDSRKTDGLKPAED